jgi:hypothetical protein
VPYTFLDQIRLLSDGFSIIYGTRRLGGEIQPTACRVETKAGMSMRMMVPSPA